MSRPIILTVTKTRAAKLKAAGPVVAVKIKIAGGGELNTILQNPFNLQGEGVDVGRVAKKVAKVAGRVVKKVAHVAPLINAASDLVVDVGGMTGQPELLALGYAGKGVATAAPIVAKLAGGSKKNSKKPRYELMTDC